ncbi:MAG TPA: hypothetical protein VH679_15530 [Vicinamibacterales bacterium]|jgi:hypothetical protein
MYLIREVMSCKPGKVRSMVEKFKGISIAMKDMGHKPFRVLTDVSGELFWTVVAETEVASLDEFFTMQDKLMASESLRKIMAGYHDLVDRGRREIFHIEG